MRGWFSGKRRAARMHSWTSRLGSGLVVTMWAFLHREGPFIRQVENVITRMFRGCTGIPWGMAMTLRCTCLGDLFHLSVFVLSTLFSSLVWTPTSSFQRPTLQEQNDDNPQLYSWSQEALSYIVRNVPRLQTVMALSKIKNGSQSESRLRTWCEHAPVAFAFDHESAQVPQSFGLRLLWVEHWVSSLIHV